MQTSRCFNQKQPSDLNTQGYGQSKADSYVLRKRAEGEAEVVLVAHVYDIFVSAHGQAAMEQLIADTSKLFAIKDLWRGELLLRLPDRTQHGGAGVLGLNQHLDVKPTTEPFEVMNQDGQNTGGSRKCTRTGHRRKQR